MRTRLLGLLVLSGLGCATKAPPPAEPLPANPPIAPAPEPVPSKPVPPPAWPAEVDTSLPAPDDFHLIRAAKDGKKILVEATGTLEFFDPHTKATSRGNTAYLAEIELATGCIDATWDFPTIGAASGTGTVPEAMAILAGPEMAKDVDRAKHIAAAYGPNDAPIRVTPDGKHVILEANNEIYWSKDGGAFTHVRGVAKGPTLSSDGRYLLFGGTPGYAPTVLELATGKIQLVTRAKGAAMSTSDLYPMANGSFVAVEVDRAETRICVRTIDPTAHVERENFCIPSKVHSATVSAMSADTRFLALHEDDGGRVTAYDTTTWKKVADGPGRPIYDDVDDQGHVGWSQAGVFTLLGNEVIRTQRLPGTDLPGTFVGFLGSRALVGHPSIAAFEFEKPLKTLKDVSPCGHVGFLEPAR